MTDNRVPIVTDDKRWLWLSANIENPAFTKGIVPIGIIGSFSRDVCAKQLKNQISKKMGGQRFPIVFEVVDKLPSDADYSAEKETLTGKQWDAEVHFLEKERSWRVIIYQKQ